MSRPPLLLGFAAGVLVRTDAAPIRAPGMMFLPPV